MARVTIPAEKRQLDEPKAVAEYLAPHGIIFEQWGVERDLRSDASNEEILEAYKPEVEKLKQQGGYVVADVINVTPETPNIDALIQKFNKEHTHSEDEVRFIVQGSGLFHIHPKNGPVFGIRLDAGDLINVPAGTEHWFDFCEDRRVRAIRLFKEKEGWTPKYIENGVHAEYAPVCWGPAYIPVSPGALKTTVGA